jgi:glucosamine--fructose-6-phosphate aminotransferase (isomerizing)
MVSHLMKRGASFSQAFREAVGRMRGIYALACLHASDRGRILAARSGPPLVIGLGEGETFLASDVVPLLPHTRRVIFLEDGDLAELTREGAEITDLEGNPVQRTVHTIPYDPVAAEKGGYKHFMQKEIFEQPQALANTLEMIAGGAGINPLLFGAKAQDILPGVGRVLILACGTSYHAGLTARYWIEQMAQIPCTVEIASEYRYRESVPSPDTLVVVISQSGETADTLAALKHARSLGMPHTLAICNVAESAIVRETELRLVTRAGPEIGVASTKAFTTQLAALALLTLVLAKVRGRLSPEKELECLTALRHLPVAVQKVLELEPAIAEWAGRFAMKHHALFLGRGMHYPIAMEGALKLKEISYIHAEAYPAGELKHGPLALVDQEMPVIAIAPNDALLEKLKSNLQEVKARGGELYVFADAGSEIAESAGLHLLHMPEHYGMLSPVLHVVPLQLLSYHAALVKGTDVDKPRNLAKSVTVE